MRADAASLSRPPAAGDVLDGRYRIVRPIARGGMATVFLAEHTLIKRRLVIKLLHAELAHDRSTIERFMTESLAAGTLGHPNIVQATDMGLANGRPYIVFDYLEGCVLAEEIYRVGGLPLRRALDIALQIASALDAAHGAEIVHLDLNSGNVMLTHPCDAFEHVNVLDFGIARFVSVDANGTQPLVALGTPEFMAPEQVYAPGWIDPRTDVYALGACLYEMLAARSPFRSDSERDVFHQILHEEPPPIDREIPVELRAAIFDRMLAKEPAQRFGTMHDALEALHAIWRALPEEPAALEPRRALPATGLNPVLSWATALTSIEHRAWRLPGTPKSRARLLTMALIAATIGGGSGYLYRRADGPVPSGPAAVAEAAPAPHRPSERTLVVEGAKQRALAIAASPMLRAAIETDAPTMLDLLTTEETFALRPGEVLEVYQGSSVLLARVPPGSAPLSRDTPDLRSLATRVQVSVPVLGRARTPAGTLVLAVPVEHDSDVIDDR
jgi:serine/threonine protein kinase